MAVNVYHVIIDRPGKNKKKNLEQKFFKQRITQWLKTYFTWLKNNFFFHKKKFNLSSTMYELKHKSDSTCTVYSQVSNSFQHS